MSPFIQHCNREQPQADRHDIGDRPALPFHDVFFVAVSQNREIDIGRIVFERRGGFELNWLLKNVLQRFCDGFFNFMELTLENVMAQAFQRGGHSIADR